ncbi:RNA polymerase factor sigma-54 [Akkermansia glycaniphila]|uniref:Rpon sigma: rna polymerase sigma-54 factor n=1 Tax=Akkermansia glycaniphila TaxID=1679444 RepID=A0A1H6MHZ0_9BACT|nr:RNA polymerase factor sigma-54 [Akkermansia glycaniphila]SEI01248.1 rpon sigma: rna polymerase sigma-54 factor [Akkermansia glycaniphila]
MSHAGMQQGMKQSMVAGASMQLFMRTLQASSMELSQIVQQAMAANPVLEEDTPREDPRHDDDGWEASSPSDGTAAAERHELLMNSLSEELSLTEHLEEQVARSGIAPPIARAALDLIGELDHRGFFEDSPEEIAVRNGIAPKILEEALGIVQDLDPPGVGARDLRDSLLIQLRQAGEEDSLPGRLLRDCWDDLVRHRYADASRTLGADEDEIQAAVQRITRLNPDPGAGFAREANPSVTPDLIVEKGKNGGLHVSLTGEHIPKLSISSAYREMLSEHAEDAELRAYLSRCFREGREFIKSITDRQETILTIAREIVRRQEPFFLEGKDHLAPMRMEDVAHALEIHPSTVSRAVSHKYLLCSHGIYELRSFFQTALPQHDGDGDALSPQAIQARIRKLVDEENPAKPLSDAKIEAALAAQGVTVARRTIAKYRDQMKILPASLRKR